MKFWRMDWFDPHMGHRIAWSTTKAGALKDKRELVKENGGAIWTLEAEIESVNVPTKRAELLDWLNFHCNSDNG